MKLKSKIFLTVSVLLGLVTACTDLDETLYDKILQDNFYQTEEEVLAAIAPVYGNLRNFTGNTWQLGTHSTDESLTPEKALGHWYGEDWPLINSHKWTSQHVRFNGAWNNNFTIVNYANKLLYQLESETEMDSELKALFIAELKMIRGWGYYNLIDLFGNIPLITSWETDDETPPTTSRNEIFNFVVDDIESNIEFLFTNMLPVHY